MLLVHIVNKYNIICMYPVQNNNITAQAVGEEVETKKLVIETTTGSGRVKYRYYSDGSVYKVIRMPFEAERICELSLEEIESDKLVFLNRDRALMISSNW